MIRAKDRLPIDIAFKKIFDHSLAVKDAMKVVAPDLARSLEMSTLERVEVGSVPARMEERHEGSVWKVRRMTGGWMYLIVLVEPELPNESAMTARVCDYTDRLLEAHDAESDADVPYPEVVPVVICGGRGSLRGSSRRATGRSARSDAQWM